MLKGESLEARNTSIPEYPIGTQSSDWQGFLADTEVAYTNEMRAYLKGSLGLKSLLVDSQIEYGGMAGTYRETGMDYIDNHAYWDHPVIPPGHWSGGTINDTSSLPKLTDLSAVARLSRDRIAGMPYSVSEYNHPAPNEFQAECVPLLASVAAFQDWDTIILHEYGRYGADAKTDAIADYFNVGSNTAKWAFLPTAAVMFRTAAIAPASESQTVRMPATFAEALAAPSASPSASPLDKRLARATGPVADVPTANAGTAKLAVRAPQTENAVFTADSARAKAVAGFVANQSVSLNGIDLVFGDCVNRFGVATVVSLDERPINEAKGVLVTALSRVQNTGEQFAPDRHSVIDWGTGPQLVDAVTADIKLAVDGPRVVYALDDTGARKSTVASTFANGILAFHIGPESASPWFLVARREK